RIAFHRAGESKDSADGRRRKDRANRRNRALLGNVVGGIRWKTATVASPRLAALWEKSIMARQMSTPWLIAILLALAIGAAWYERHSRVANYRIEAAAPGQIVSVNHLAPAEDLVQIYLVRQEGAHKSVDIAKYG